MPKVHLASWKEYLKSPKRKFQEHKQHARMRGVPFTLTFDEWWDIWAKSGKWDKRGRGRGKFCMHRVKDEGGYSTGNVYIGMNEANSYGSAMTNLHHRAHPDALKEANSTIPGYDPECGF